MCLYKYVFLICYLCFDFVLNVFEKFEVEFFFFVVVMILNLYGQYFLRLVMDIDLLLNFIGKLIYM